MSVTSIVTVNTLSWCLSHMLFSSITSFCVTGFWTSTCTFSVILKFENRWHGFNNWLNLKLHTGADFLHLHDFPNLKWWTEWWHNFWCWPIIDFYLSLSLVFVAMILVFCIPSFQCILFVLIFFTICYLSNMLTTCSTIDYFACQLTQYVTNFELCLCLFLLCVSLCHSPSSHNITHHWRIWKPCSFPVHWWTVDFILIYLH